MGEQREEEWWGLAGVAQEAGLRDTLVNAPTETLLETLKSKPEAREWRQRFDGFLQVHGNRISAAHLDVIFPTWKEDPRPVLETIKSYFGRMDSGWDHFQARNAVIQQRAQAIAEFEKRVSAEDKPVFH